MAPDLVLASELVLEGMSPEDAIAKVGMVVEGMFTAEAAYELAKLSGVEMPITETVCRLCHEGLPAKEAISILMNRPMKGE